MTEDRFRDFEVRLRKVEDFILSQLSILIELSQALKNKVEVLEEHDMEFMTMVHNSFIIKDKEIIKAKEDAIETATTYTNNVHNQTWVVIATMFSMFIGAVIYFNIQVTERAMASQKNTTNIENITHVLDKIDSKLDKLGDYSHTVKDNK